jgi:hypothetical protein
MYIADIRFSFDKLSDLQRVYYAERKRADALLEHLFNDLGFELRTFRHLCPDPMAFLNRLVPVNSTEAMCLRDWKYLCSIMEWDTPWTFETDDQFAHFFHFHVRSVDVPEELPSLLSMSPLTPLPAEWDASPPIAATPIEELVDRQSSTVSEPFAGRSLPGTNQITVFRSQPFRFSSGQRW